MNAFRFVGKLEFNALDSRNPYIRKGKTAKGAEYQTLSFSVAPSKNNRAYVESFGMVSDKIKTYDTTGNEKTVLWDERLDENVIKEVSRSGRWSVKLDGVYHEFISAYDFNDFVAEHMEELKNKVCVVTGKLNTNVYNGKLSYRYQIQSVREVGEGDDVEQKLVIRFDTFYRKEDIDVTEWKKERKITINAFTHNYVKEANGRKYTPTTFTIELANEDNDKKAAFLLKQFGIILKDGSIGTKIKDKEVVSLPIRCEYINGSEEVPFDESCLTDNQKEMIELGLKSLDDFKPNGSIYGQRVTKYICIDVDARDDYANGYRVEEISAGEFETEIFTPAASVKNVADNMDDEDIDSLFGT